MNAQIAATTEILHLLEASREDEAPVFEAILKYCRETCNAPIVGLILAKAEDDVQTLAGHPGLMPSMVEQFKARQKQMDASVSLAAKCILDCEVLSLADLAESPQYQSGSPVVRTMVDESGMRSALFVPLLQNEAAIGAIVGR